jgi:hypothetical protein
VKEKELKDLQVPHHSGFGGKGCQGEGAQELAGAASFRIWGLGAKVFKGRGLRNLQVPGFF